MVIGIILSVIDILAGGFLLVSAPVFANYLAFIFLAKGLFSLLSSFSMRYFFDWMGFIDVIVGIAFGLMSFGMFFGSYSFIGWIVLLKGIYSLARFVLKF